MARRALPLLVGAVGISTFGDMLAFVQPPLAGLGGLTLHARKRAVLEAPASVSAEPA